MTKDNIVNGPVKSHPLFNAGVSVADAPSTPKQFCFWKCSVDKAIELNRTWHSLLPKIVKSNVVRNTRCICYLAAYGGFDWAVAIWTDPVAANKLPDGRRSLELRRFAICETAPRNTASCMLAWMRKDIKRLYPELVKLISYQDMGSHVGTIYLASGWIKASTSRNVHWDTGSRVRSKPKSLAKKTRWEWSYD